MTNEITLSTELPPEDRDRVAQKVSEVFEGSPFVISAADGDAAQEAGSDQELGERMPVGVALALASIMTVAFRVEAQINAAVYDLRKAKGLSNASSGQD